MSLMMIDKDKCNFLGKFIIVKEKPFRVWHSPYAGHIGKHFGFKSLQISWEGNKGREKKSMQARPSARSSTRVRVSLSKY